MKVTLIIDGVTIIDAQEFIPGSSVVPGFPPYVPGAPNGPVVPPVTPPVTTPPVTVPGGSGALDWGVIDVSAVNRDLYTPCSISFVLQGDKYLTWAKLPPIKLGPNGANVDGNAQPAQGGVRLSAGVHRIKFTEPGFRMVVQVV